MLIKACFKYSMAHVDKRSSDLNDAALIKWKMAKNNLSFEYPGPRGLYGRKHELKLTTHLWGTCVGSLGCWFHVNKTSSLNDAGSCMYCGG